MGFWLAEQICPGPMCSAYVRLQAELCHRLSRSCMDLGTARDLRLMADEYFAEAAKIEAASSAPAPQ